MHGLPAPSLHLIWSSPSVMIPCQIVPIDKPGAVSYPTQSRLQLREGFKFRRGWFFPHSPSGSVQPALLRCFQHRSLARSRAEIIGPRSVERKGGLDLQLLEQNAPPQVLSLVASSTRMVSLAYCMPFHSRRPAMPLTARLGAALRGFAKMLRLCALHTGAMVHRVVGP